MASAFKWRHFSPDIILLCVRWYCRYSLSYRDLEEMMKERGLSVDHTTVYRWVQHYAPELEKRIQWYQNRQSRSWRVDETYVKVRGEWKYLFRAITSDGRTLDFYLSNTRSTKAAKRFLSKAVRRAKHDRPSSITTDKNPAYIDAIRQLKVEGLIKPDCDHRRQKYLNNRIECHHGGLKQRIRHVRGFQSKQTATATLKGFEVMRMFRKRQFDGWLDAVAYGREACFIGRLFNVFIPV